ncbi:YkvA family protein [Microlunatus sp. Gsoil 973]|uniref:YkvA family protein n=1 Tax=Microlunatus sp. Gsoil 973 TaxID=2672569 RepID=UPI0012B4ACB5|nr:DUF1232 domain-containing protein [Microlunatus sp. Gsoil 973]QGN34115.1 DUF1232 domain-containing protein [Microlunatus sp. Gsoil 973]
MWWHALIGIAVGLLVAYLILLGLLWLASRRAGDPVRLREGMRLLPDLIRLIRRLVADPDLPRGVRVRLALLLGYLLLPVDLVPDFIPVLGYADDAIILVIALRSITRRAGPEALTRHWPGTPAGLAAVRRFAGLPAE